MNLEAAATGSRVYFFTNAGRTEIKIGVSKDVRRRAGQLETDVILSISGTERDETLQHKMWRGYRQGRSEWFLPGENLLLYLFALAWELKNDKALDLLCEIYENRWNALSQAA